MTTPATGRKLTTACNGVTKIFACPVFQQPADLQVYLLNASTDPNSAGTLLVSGVDYVLSGSGPAGTGQITTTIAYPNGKFVRRFRKTSRAQGVQVPVGQGLPAATQEGALDRLSLIDEEHDDDISALIGAQLIASNTILGNLALAPAVPVALTAAQVAGILPAVTGDTGAGGVKGMVPAPGAGDAANLKFLRADGTWATPPSATGVLLAPNSILGNNSGGPAAFSLTPAQINVMLPAVVGDAGAGGTKGLAPAPGVGDAAAGKFLKADGTWANPPGGGAGTTTNPLTFSSAGDGDVATSTFTGLVGRKISYNSIGAAPLNSPGLTGAPTAPTPAGGDNSTKLATTAFVAAAVAALINAAPGALDTLKELGDAIGDDANFAATMTTALAGKAPVRPAFATPNASFAAADADNNSHKVMSGAGQTLTLPNITAGTAFTARFTTAWALACAGGLSKNGAAPGGVTTGNVAANSLITFLHEGAGVWLVSGSGLT